MYDNKIYTLPIWEGETIYHESFMPVEGRIVPLLYRADKILSLTNAEQTVTFTEGEDYLLRDGAIYIPEGSRISIMPWEEYNPSGEAPNRYNPSGFTCSRGGFLKFAEGAEFHLAQYAVTYAYSDKWDGPLPLRNDARLSRTRAALKNGEPLKVGYHGDSIATGANSSKFVGAQPNASGWPEMIVEQLNVLSGGENVRCINKAVGGMASGWGIGQVEPFFRDDPPDLLVIAFGMNDASGGVDKLVFRDNTREMIDIMLSINPSCEFILVSTSLPNPLASQFVRDHDTHEPLLYALADEYPNSVDVAPVTSVHKHLLTKKRYFDMTGNNINHPNDFLARVYAQTILATIL